MAPEVWISVDHYDTVTYWREYIWWHFQQAKITSTGGSNLKLILGHWERGQGYIIPTMFVHMFLLKTRSKTLPINPLPFFPCYDFFHPPPFSLQLLISLACSSWLLPPGLSSTLEWGKRRNPGNCCAPFLSGTAPAQRADGWTIRSCACPNKPRKSKLSVKVRFHPAAVACVYDEYGRQKHAIEGHIVILLVAMDVAHCDIACCYGCGKNKLWHSLTVQ